MAKVTAPLVAVRLANGEIANLYAGEPLPGGLAGGELDRLREHSLIDESGDQDAGVDNDTSSGRGSKSGKSRDKG